MKSPLFLLALASLSPLHAQSPSFASLSGSDYLIYEDRGGELFVNQSAPLLEVLQGSASAAGGNVELFNSSDSIGKDNSPASSFANTTPTVLTANFGPHGTSTVRSLNGQDWFTSSSGYLTTYGADNLANSWFQDFLGAMRRQGNALVTSTIAGNEESLFNSFRDNGGFAQMSDPNISYIQNDGTTTSVGLGGFLDARPRMEQLLGMADGTLALGFPNGLQVSEIAIVNDTAVYSFSGVDSGTYLNDGVDSYSATYEVSVPNNAVPEPSSLVLLSLAGLFFIRRRA